VADEREERLARNEAIFRVGNERMAAWEERHREAEVEEYMCECADPDCRAKVPLTQPDYERIRSDSCHFVVVPGHEIPDVETVIEEHDDWVIVEKDPEVQAIVERTDPRRG
jgi:hypothetical protein